MTRARGTALVVMLVLPALTNIQSPVRMVFAIIMAWPFLNVFDDQAELDRYLDRTQKGP